MSVIYKIKSDLSNLSAVMLSYDTKMKNFKEELRLDGRTFQQASVQQSAYSAYYDQIAQELDVMVDEMELRIKEARMKAYTNIRKVSPKDYPERTLNLMLDGDPEVLRMTRAMLEVAERLKKAKSYVKSFETRGYSINNLTKQRQAEFLNQTIYLDE